MWLLQFLPLMLLVLIVWAVVRAVKRRGAPGGRAKRASHAAKLPNQQGLQLQEALELDEDDVDELDVVGESHYQAELRLISAAMELKGWDYCRAVIRREPANKHDANAVRVEIAGLLVGYIPREEAVWVSAALKKKRKATMELNADMGGRDFIGVTLYMPAGALD